MQNNSDKQRWFNITAATTTAGHADIYLYGIIGGWRINIRTFMDDLRQYKNLKTINVYISTPGGSFMDGLPIYQTLRQHKAHITTINMGYAVSMGSVIMLAGDTIKMGHNCLMMIHSPNVMLWDNVNARELRKEATVLDTHEQAMLPRYQERMGLEADAVATLLHEETWYTAEKAKNAGLIDEITDPVDLADIDAHMTEDHWLETAAQMRREPPKDFLQHLSRHIPDAGNILNFSTRKPIDYLPTGQGDIQQDEDNVMTPEQMTELKGHFDTAITQAAQQGATRALEGVDTRITQAVATATESQANQLNAVQESLTAASGKIDNAVTTLTTLAEKQPEMADALKGVVDTLDEVKKLPVNNFTPPPETIVKNAAPGKPIYS